MALVCPSCHSDVMEADARYCPHCSVPLESLHRFSLIALFPVISGLLQIIASALALELASQGFVDFSGYMDVLMWDWQRLNILQIFGNLPNLWLQMMVLGFASFGFGMVGGIVATEKRHFWVAIVGSVALVASGFVTVLQHPRLASGLVAGPPLVAVGVMSFLFLLASKSRFVRG